MAVAVLTQPDSGLAGSTVRWPPPGVTYRLQLDGYPDSYLAEVRAAFAWAARHTRLLVVESDSAASIEVVKQRGAGAHTTVWIGADDEITSARVELGCCRPRAAWEDLLQSFGPLGDRADRRSIFSDDQTLVRPQAFDAWVMRALYSLPPGARPEQLADVLAATC